MYPGGAGHKRPEFKHHLDLPDYHSPLRGQGYRLSSHTGLGQEIELASYGYEATEALDCVDSQEVPVLILVLITETLDQVTRDLYYSNYVVCEVWDCRARGGGG